ncbi:hypothetical protein [uncultured Vibrio sp.]|uniref:hypothetical protein n=1 Tax=uncultured Vibrio sp. TaxID=114054 RepID=UPI0029C863A3|nr:hypothetical protein [uncultured Vibrio sp.]
MATRTIATLLAFGLTLTGCASDTSPQKDTVNNIQDKCALILSGQVSEDQRWQVYNDLLQEYAKHAIHNQADSDRFNAFIQVLQLDQTRQLMTELIEVTDWGCANGNYLEEMTMFIEEVAK